MSDAPRDGLQPMTAFVRVLFVLGVLIGPAHAQTEVQAAVSWDSGHLPDVKPVQVALTPDAIERFIASLPDLIALSRDLDRAHGRSENARLDEDLAFLLAPHLFDPAAEQHIEAELNRFGFDTYAQWANVAHSIALAVEAADFTGSIDLGSQEKAARRDIEADKKLSAEERTKALEDLRSQFAALAEFEPLAGNREIALPYIQRLRAATGG